MRTSLPPCAGLLGSVTGRRAARACRQVAARDKSCGLADRDGSEDAGERTASRPLPALRRLTQVSPSVTLTACAMYAGRSRAQSRDVLRASRRGRRQQQQCDGEQQRARDDRRRRCGPAACDRVARAVDGCGRGLAGERRRQSPPPTLSLRGLTATSEQQSSSARPANGTGGKVRQCPPVLASF